MSLEKDRTKNKKSYYKYREARLKKYREYDRDVKTFRKYGITTRNYDWLFLKQKGCCAICGRNQSEVREHRRLSVDHDHKTGKVRGLLCLSCNTKLGWLENNKNVIDFYLGGE